MPNTEYVVSLLVAVLVLAGAAAWTQAVTRQTRDTFACRPGVSTPPVTLRGMSLYPACRTTPRSGRA